MIQSMLKFNKIEQDDRIKAKVAEFVARQRQIVDMLTAEKNRLKPASKRVKKDIKAHLTWLEKRLERTEISWL